MVNSTNCCPGVVRTFEEGITEGKLVAETAQCWEDEHFCIARYQLDPAYEGARAALLAALAKANETIYSPKRGKQSPLACETAIKKHGGFWGPFLP